MKKDTRTFLVTIASIPLLLLVASGIHASFVSVCNPLPVAVASMPVVDDTPLPTPAPVVSEPLPVKTKPTPKPVTVVKSAPVVVAPPPEPTPVVVAPVPEPPVSRTVVRTRRTSAS